VRRLAKFLRLPTAERRLLFSALFHLAAARIGLWTLPLEQIVKRLPQTKKPVFSEKTGFCRPKEIAWAIRAAGRYLPGGQNCLAQALAGQALLARRGIATQLRIGVAKDAAGRFTAHAWVECDGRILIGGAGAAQFTALPPLEWEPR
jgi:hypothetical protein